MSIRRPQACRRAALILQRLHEPTERVLNCQFPRFADDATLSATSLNSSIRSKQGQDAHIAAHENPYERIRPLHGTSLSASTDTNILDLTGRSQDPSEAQAAVQSQSHPSKSLSIEAKLLKYVEAKAPSRLEDCQDLRGRGRVSKFSHLVIAESERHRFASLCLLVMDFPLITSRASPNLTPAYQSLYCPPGINAGSRQSLGEPMNRPAGENAIGTSRSSSSCNACALIWIAPN